jgi:hypothetical protein
MTLKDGFFDYPLGNDNFFGKCLKAKKPTSDAVDGFYQLVFCAAAARSCLHRYAPVGIVVTDY